MADLPRPGRLAALLLALLLGVLALDHFADRRQQALLGVLMFAALAAIGSRLTPQRRAQLAIVLVVACLFEVLGSIVWGVYRYRLGNLPLFVPPGHGMVYLAGVALSQTGPIRRAPRAFVAAVVAAAAVWAVVGLLSLPGRLDALGAFGVVVFVVLMRRSPAPPVLAAVFLVVGMLELFGTAIGTWRWVETVPGMGVPQGNPPSGAASGYVIFDIAALALCPALLRLVSGVRARATPVPAVSPGATAAGAE